MERFLLWKTLSFSLSLFLPLHLSLTHSFCSFLPVSAPSSAFLPLLSPAFLYAVSSASRSLALSSPVAALLSMASRFLQTLFSQDASLQGLLHQNGIETGSEMGVVFGSRDVNVVDFFFPAYGGKM